MYLRKFNIIPNTSSRSLECSAKHANIIILMILKNTLKRSLSLVGAPKTRLLTTLHHSPQAQAPNHAAAAAKLPTPISAMLDDDSFDCPFVVALAGSLPVSLPRDDVVWLASVPDEPEEEPADVEVVSWELPLPAPTAPPLFPDPVCSAASAPVLVLSNPPSLRADPVAVAASPVPVETAV